MKAFCISTDNEEGWRRFKTTLKLFDGILEMERFPGVWPPPTSAPDWFTLGKPLTETRRREFGCMLAHMNAILNAKRLGLESVLILEDDIVPVGDVGYAMDMAETWLPRCGIFYVGYMGGLVEKMEWRHDRTAILRGRILGTHAYAIHGSMYDEVLNMQSPKAIDMAFSEMSKNREFRGVVPAAILQRAGYSQITRSTKTGYRVGGKP